VGETTLGTTVGNLGFDETRFPNPVFIGDTITAVVEVLAIKETKPILTLRTDCVNQDRENRGRGAGRGPHRTRVNGTKDRRGLTWALCAKRSSGGLF
jgi:acyl dehydratase